MLAYFMGMLTRYFPTHWVALHSGTKGDRLWPTISATQNYVESVFPELVIELIYDSLSESKVTA
jgi:YaaC-like protein